MGQASSWRAEARGPARLARRELHQIPAVSVEILEHRDLAIGLVRGRPDEADAGFGVGGEVAIEIVGLQEEEDAPARLIADEAFLPGRGCAGEEDGGGMLRRAGRADRHPALVLLRLVAVLDQGEAELADVEGERFVIVADDEGDMG